MNLLEKDLKLLLDTLADRCTTETMRSGMDTMKQSMDDGEIPPTETVRSFIQHPEQPTDLTAFQQALARVGIVEKEQLFHGCPPSVCASIIPDCGQKTTSAVDGSAKNPPSLLLFHAKVCKIDCRIRRGRYRFA